MLTYYFMYSCTFPQICWYFLLMFELTVLAIQAIILMSRISKEKRYRIKSEYNSFLNQNTINSWEGSLPCNPNRVKSTLRRNVLASILHVVLFFYFHTVLNSFKNMILPSPVCEAIYSSNLVCCFCRIQSGSPFIISE